MIIISHVYAENTMVMIAYTKALKIWRDTKFDVIFNVTLK